MQTGNRGQLEVSNSSWTATYHRTRETKAGDQNCQTEAGIIKEAQVQWKTTREVASSISSSIGWP